MSLKKLSVAFVLVLLAFVAAPKSASASTIGFSCLTDNSGDCAGFEPFFYGTVTVAGGLMTVDIFNDGSDGVITLASADFPDPQTGLFSFNSFDSSPGAEFAVDLGNLPAGNTATPPFDEDFGVGATPPPAFNGVLDGEFVRLVFNLLDGQSQADIDTLLQTGGIRFGLHVQSLGEGEDSEALISFCAISDCGGREGDDPVVPEPATMVLLGTGLLAAARTARRRKTS